MSTEKTEPRHRIQEHIEALREALAAGQMDKARSLLNALHVADAALLIESLPGRLRAEVWPLIEDEGAILSQLSDDVRSDLLEGMSPDKVAEATRDLASDDAADILQDLPESAVARVLSAMDRQNRERLASILIYPEATAGGLMNTDVVPIRPDVSLGVVRRYLKQLGRLPGKTDQLMVVDRDNYHLGTLPFADVFMRPSEQTVAEVMTRDEGIAASMADAEVARFFGQRDLLSAAVVDEHGKLLGRITVDDVIDVMQRRIEHTLRSMAGVEEGDIFAPVLLSTRRRALWLGANLLTAFVAAWAIGHFQDVIQELVALAVLMPIVAGMGGVAGIQTLTLAIRGIALKQLGRSNLPSLLGKELAVGVLNGLIWSAVLSAIVLLWFDSRFLAIIIAAAMLINLIFAAVCGAVIPFILVRFRVDPAVAGGVLLTTVTDVVGFVSFLGLAALFIEWAVVH